MKKLFASLSIVTLMFSLFAPVAQVAAATPQSYVDAYKYMVDQDLTTTDTFDKFNFYGAMQRAHLAAFATRWADANLDLDEVHANSACQFADLGAADPSLKDEIVKACMYGLMGINSATSTPATDFNSKSIVTRGQALTVLARMLGSENGGTPYWKTHEAFLYNKKIVTVTHPAADANSAFLRGYQALTLMRADDYVTTNPVDGDTGSECEGLDAVEDKELWNLLECGAVVDDTTDDTDDDTDDTDDDTTPDYSPTCDGDEGTLEVILSPDTQKPSVGQKVYGNST